uniref:Uncharacterized protein n=1 Tax=Wuchereria bancrofti TaxID=6293 RepID=A0A1I8EXE0_WUCBA
MRYTQRGQFIWDFEMVTYFPIE